MNDSDGLTRRRLLGGLAAASAAVLPGCPHPTAPAGVGWDSAQHVEHVVPAWSWAPTSAAALVDAVGRAEREGRRIRMTGSGHSFSDVAVCDDWLLSSARLSRVLTDPDPTTLRPGAAEGRTPCVIS